MMFSVRHATCCDTSAAFVSVSSAFVERGCHTTILEGWVAFNLNRRSRGTVLLVCVSPPVPKGSTSLSAGGSGFE